MTDKPNAFVAYHLGGGRWGVKNAAGERVAEWTGNKEEAQAEALRLSNQQPAAPGGTAGQANESGGEAPANSAGDEGAGTTGQDALLVTGHQDLGEFDDSYVVNRERLEHDGELYTFGDQVVIEDEKAAGVLVTLGAIQRGSE
ncbi:hypothetical protein [Pseudomonas paralcaligenes]|uniref:hypothetical protein n=1 Tax=Pseudomonas paralcaligenes TaxID=2772558 RepID=UPI001C822975|nr:hypothetical protein [Pseudomonas paralcaligenes]